MPRTRRISPRRCAGRAVNQLELLRAGSAPLYTVECWVMSQDYGKVSGTERIAQGRRVGGLGPRRRSSLHRASLIKQAPVATCGPSACTSLVAAPHTSRAPVRRGGRKRADCRFASPTVLGPTPTPRRSNSTLYWIYPGPLPTCQTPHAYCTFSPCVGGPCRAVPQPSRGDAPGSAPTRPRRCATWPRAEERGTHRAAAWQSASPGGVPC